MEAYLTAEDLEIAKQNGISRRLARKRYDELFWTKIDAITKPPRSTQWKQYQLVCQENGVTQRTFNKRIRNGVEPKLAASIPPVPFNERCKGYKGLVMKYGT